MTDTVRLNDVCTLASDRTCAVERTEAALRQGPYPLYADNCAIQGSEDWEFEAGGTIMVPALGTVLASDGRLMASLEKGRCSATSKVLPIVAHDPADAQYIWRALTTLKVPVTCVGGTPQLRQVSPTGLMCTRIPWPDRRERQAYVEALDACEARISDMHDVVPILLRQADEAFGEMAETGGGPRKAGDLAEWRRGTNVPLAARGADKPVPIEGASGELGRCDDALASRRCIVMGAAARRVLAHVAPGPSHPVADTIYAQDEDARIPLPVLFFALRAAGIHDRVRLDGKDLPGSARTLEDALSMTVQVGDERDWPAFIELAEGTLARIEAARRERERAIADRMATILQFEKTGNVDSALVGRYVGTAETTCGQTAGGDGASAGADAAAEARVEARPAGTDAHTAAKAHTGMGGEGTGIDRPCGRSAQGHDSPGSTHLGTLVDSLAAEHGLAVADIAWEVAPVAVLRARLEPALWNALVSTAHRVADGRADVDLARFVDAALDNVATQGGPLSFMGELSYKTSQLDASALADLVLGLDGIGAGLIDGRAIRGLLRKAGGDETDGGRDQIGRLVDVVAGACAAVGAERGLVEMAYVPRDDAGIMADAAGRAARAYTLAAQTPDIADALAAALVRDRLTAATEGPDGGPAAGPSSAGSFVYRDGDALTADAFPLVKASLVLADLPPNARDWCAGAIDANDPRWMLGAPPRNKANFAWLQHCLAHLLPGGLAVVLATNAPLHSCVGSEKDLRRRLAESGRLRLAASLPARMGGDGPARTLLVLGDELPTEEWRCLMVNALDAGVPDDGNRGRSRRRVLPEGVLRRVCELCCAWIGRGEANEAQDAAWPDVPHAVVGMAEVESRDWLLTPWTYAR